MKVVNVEENYSSAIQRLGTSYPPLLGRGGATSGGQLHHLVGASGSHTFEEFYRLRLAINAQFEVFSPEPVHKASLFIKDHDVRLDQIGVDADDVFRLLQRFRL